MRTFCLCLLAATLAACSGEREGDGPGSPEPTVTVATATPTSTAAPQAPKPRATAHEGSTVVRAVTDDALYVADEDHGVVRRIALPIDARDRPRVIPMPGQPAQVLALADRVLVTIRSAGAVPPGTPSVAAAADPSAAEDAGADAGSKQAASAPVPRSATGPGLLMIMRPDPTGLVEIARVELPQDAWGVAVTPDESTAIVTSAWTHKVSIVDLTTAKVRASLDVPREPRAVVVHPDGGSAWVTHLVGPDLTRIDDLRGEPKVRAIALPPSPLRTPVGKRLGASLAYSAALSPDGSRLFVPRHALGAIGPQVWFGATTVDVMLTGDDTPLAPMRRDGPRKFGPNNAFSSPQAMVEDLESGGTAPRVDPTPFAQPRALVYRKSKDTLLVLSEGAGRMVELDARALDPTMHVVSSSTVCDAPSGIALSADEETAWIFCRGSYNLVIWSFAWTGPRPFLELAEELLPADAARGRKRFYDAADTLVSGGLGCAGCHPEGRDDGHVWHETTGVSWSHATFVSAADNVPQTDPEKRGFARQTPMLVGRLVAEGPYGWHAESGVLTKRLIEGFSLHRWSDTFEDHMARDLYDRAMDLRAFLRKGLVPPPKPEAELSAVAKRGRDIFLGGETGCAQCHLPASDYSDRETYALFSQLPPPRGFAEDPEKKYKTPSLRFVGGTPPYMHDGRFATLQALIDQNGDRMGKTKQLSAADRAALVAFLETL